MDEAVKGLVERVDRLERSAKQWRRAAIGLGVVLVVGFAVGAQPPAKSLLVNKLEAKEIVVSDGDGHGSITIDSITGKARFRLMNANGDAILTIGENAFGGFVNTADPLKKDITAYFGGWKNVGGRIRLWNPQNKTAIELPWVSPLE